MKILVIGGYGNFGKRLVKSLLGYSDHEVVIAGRSFAKSSEMALSLFEEFGKLAESIELDALSHGITDSIIEQAPDVVVNASGPYHFQFSQNQDSYSNYQVAQGCLKAKCHYIDLADHREYVKNFAQLFNTQAQKLGLIFITGASTVPSLTDAVIQQNIDKFSELTSINYGISPGNKTERGKGTIASILSYTGKTFKTQKNGRPHNIYGWQDLTSVDFGQPIGKRWMSNCDIPDLDLLPEKYPSLNSVTFKAGLEVGALHIGLWILSFFSRFNWVSNWSHYSKQLTYLSEWFSSFGSDCGGMFVELEGKDLSEASKKISWQLVAEDGVGPNIPAIPAEILINKLSQNKLLPGARVCMGMFTLREFFNIADRWNIYQKSCFVKGGIAK